jgi:hypothetical protein
LRGLLEDSNRVLMNRKRGPRLFHLTIYLACYKAEDYLGFRGCGAGLKMSKDGA